ncbi:unnamed protein product [Blepharisma stoltei]|uniref:Uncharacterized protein n=1 Tax=Blepharisma stoltei TaxID=1481888 RepID=A0AAU9INY5_9CILI|nr:unnamed protein product [Blepharisma stoltei]
MADLIEGLLKICCNESLCKCLSTDCCSICQSMPCDIFSNIGSCCCKMCECCLASSAIGNISGDCKCKCRFPKCSDCDQILFAHCVQKVIHNTAGVSIWCDYWCNGISRGIKRCCDCLNIFTCFGIPINDNVYYNSYGNNYNNNYNNNIVVINEMGNSEGQKNSNQVTKKADSTPAATANPEYSHTANPEYSQIEIQNNSQAEEEGNGKENEEMQGQAPMIEADESISAINVEIESD